MLTSVFNTPILRGTDKLNQLKLTLNNKYQALQDLPKEEETTMVDKWKGIKEALTPTCQEVLGSEKHHHKEWISIKTLNKMKERKNKKTTIYNSRTGTEKVKKCVKDLATTVEKAVTEGNIKQLCGTKKKLVRKYSKPEKPVNDKEGRSIIEIEKKNRWAEHFEELLNRPNTLNAQHIKAAHTDLPTVVTPPTIE
ncbi:unnamed protein product [Schistosoma margrebowiei]|uniref:Uncharacterized protein n=1 Tax=Schistosoma margrebowiei TaxID=48269 RepID=A0A183LAA2_9TREM|nr:unnamed protein product [Schistosoma margrebowiei]